MKKIAAFVVAAALTSPAMAAVNVTKFGADKSDSAKCNTWNNGKYTLQPSTTRNTDNSKRR
jgi:hypothetical protein